MKFTKWISNRTTANNRSGKCWDRNKNRIKPKYNRLIEQYLSIYRIYNLEFSLPEIVIFVFLFYFCLQSYVIRSLVKKDLLFLKIRDIIPFICSSEYYSE